jgi:hypothetical protein
MRQARSRFVNSAWTESAWRMGQPCVRPLDMNSAEVLDMESVVGLLRRESAAVLQYRSKLGPFTSIADLKDLDPVILKKIEARKDRVVFLTPTENPPELV